jgi:hypothetical protein
VRLLSWASYPLHLTAVLSGAKSFRDNPVLGSPALNARGLHAWRATTAERMADARRRRLADPVPEALRDAYRRDGVVVVPDALPPERFAALRGELDGRPLPAREMRQGRAVTRFIDLDPAVLAGLPETRALLDGPLFAPLLRYVAGCGGAPLFYAHTVISDADGPGEDPQTALHSDTFHATAKGWLFLRDVAPEDGPFTYVLGSHRLTPGRLAWERAQSVAAASHRDGMHARGSFRATLAEVEAMGFAPPVAFPVRANTLVIADTHGFHARGRSQRPSVRTAIYGSLRRNPFLPWTGLDPMALPGLRGREGVLFGAWLDARSRLTGRRNPQPRVGMAAPDDPAPRV